MQTPFFIVWSGFEHMQTSLFKTTVALEVELVGHLHPPNPLSILSPGQAQTQLPFTSFGE